MIVVVFWSSWLGYMSSRNVLGSYVHVSNIYKRVVKLNVYKRIKCL